MNIRLILVCTIFLIIVFVDIGDGKSTRRRTGSSGWGFGSRSRTTSRPRTHQTSHTSYQQTNQGNSKTPPNNIGWNIPDKKPTGTNTAPKPSAPVSEHSAKTSATNVQSGYTPSGGYPRQPASNPYHTNSQPAGQVYNPSVGQGYNPSMGQGYNPSVGQGYHPSVGQGYNPTVGGHVPYGAQPSYGNPSFGGYNPGVGQPSFGQSFSPSMGHVPQQTILVQSAQKPGIGQLAKEAFVFAGVSAGVNAAVNRLIPGGIYGTRGSSGDHGGASHTEITYNNYYNNGTAPVPAPAPSSEQAAAANPAPAAAPSATPTAAQPVAQPAAETPQSSQSNAGTNSASPGNVNSQESPQNNPNPLGFVTSNDDIKKLTESLFEKDKNNAFRYITMNLQGQKKDDSTTDDAPEPLLSVKDEAYEIPTIKAMLPLHDNYELDVKTKETVTAEERKEESELIDKILETDVIKATMKFLADKGYIPDDEYEFKDTLKRIWFSQFKRVDGDASSSGFETVFLAEQFDSDIIGLHNWIYYAKQEADKKLNYLGYIKEVKFSDKGAVLKIRSSLNGMVQPLTTIFVGTSPELEFALYTMCFFTRPNNACPVSLGGAEFMIIVSRVNYFGKDILISAYPDI